MSHRTHDLEQLSGIAHIVRELRYHEVSRQSLAVILILVFALTSQASPLSAAIGMTAAFIGEVIRYWASGYIMKNKVLAQNGPYAMVRHPLYTGNILLVTGFAIAGLTLWALPLTLFFFWFYYPPAIEYEDRKLKSIFGQDWTDWSTETPALMPKFSNASKIGGGDWSFRTSLRKNGELFIVIFSLACAWRVIAPLI